MSQKDIEDLQTRVSFQEDLIESLNSRIAEQQMDIDKLILQLQHLNRKFKDMEFSMDNPAGSQQEPPPPHY